MDSADAHNKPRTRKRKVYYKYSRRARKSVIHPAIRIDGLYLKEYGFNIGDNIEIACEEGQIMIRKLMP
ncbi:MAG: SymE family type I addiction module toxin [Bacteroidia bacterium]